MKRKERDDNDEGEAGSSSMDVSPQKKRIRFSEEVKVTTIPKSVLKMEKMEVGMGVEEEVAMVRDILGVAGAVEEISQKQEREDYEKEAREKSRELFKEELEEEEEDATRIDERAKVVPLGEANDRFLAKPDEVRMEPFNMKREMDYGSFVGGHYVEKREEKDVEDNWFDGVMENIDSQGEGYYSKARKIELDRQKKRAKANKEEDDEEMGGEERVGELKRKILELLNDGESVSGALRRLAPPKKERKKRRGGKGGEEMAIDNKEGKEEVGAQVFEELSSLAADVYSLGVVDIYEQKKEQMEGDVKGMKWEYKGAGGELQGPYTRKEMEGWKGGGVFCWGLCG